MQTERLIIKPLDKSDAQILFEYRSDPLVSRFQSWKPDKIKDAELFIEKYSTSDLLKLGEWRQQGIYLKENNELIGDLGLHLFDTRQVEIGFTIAPDHQKMGYGFEGINAVIENLFRVDNLHRVIATTDPMNEASIKLLTKLGFRKEGHSIKSIYIFGEWKDDLLFAILKEEKITRK